MKGRRTCGWVVKFAVLAAGVAHAVPANADGPPTPMCAADSLDGALVQHLRAGEFLDAHGLALVLLSLCPLSPGRFQWKIVDALALDALAEPLRAQHSFFEVAEDGPSPEREFAAILLARSHLIVGDDRAFTEAVGRLAPPVAARVCLFAARDDAKVFRHDAAAMNDRPFAATVLKAFNPYDRAMQARRPWLAGTLSALLPGAGQIYAGSWQGAAVAFVLNGVLIGATVELAYHRLYFSAGATGMAASIFYVGNVLNAADLAARRNEQSALPHRDALERLLIPEAFP